MPLKFSVRYTFNAKGFFTKNADVEFSLTLGAGAKMRHCVWMLPTYGLYDSTNKLRLKKVKELFQR